MGLQYMTDMVLEQVSTSSGGEIMNELEARFGSSLRLQMTVDGIPTAWIERSQIIAVMRFLKFNVAG